MGDTIWVDVRGRGENETPDDSTMLLRMEEQLERLATALNVTRLSTFYDYSELEDYYQNIEDAGDSEYIGESEDTGETDDTGEIVEDVEPRGSWLDPADALTTVQAIHDHLLHHPEALSFQGQPSQSHWPDQLMSDLEYCRAVLQKAVLENRQIRFLIVP